jgi:hypothetical protein
MENIIYVSPSGKDSGDGSKNSPISSLKKAQELVRNHPMFRKSPIRVLLAGGICESQEPLRFTSEDSGTSEAPIIWGCQDASISVLTASITLQFNWKPIPNSNEIFETEIPELIRPYLNSGDAGIWMNETQLHMARYPNYAGDYDFKGNGVSNEAVHEQRIKTWKNPRYGMIHGLAHHEWGSVHYQILGKKDETHLELKQIPTINREANLHPEFRFVENIREELDDPGEYYYERETHKLFLIPPVSIENNIQALNQAIIRIATHSRIISLEGSEIAPVQYLQFHNLQFQYTQRSLNRTWEPLTRGDWTIVREAAVFLTGTQNIEFKNCTFQEIATNAVFISNFNRDVKIDGCEFTKIGESAICFVGNHRCVRSVAVGYHTKIPYSAMDLASGPLRFDFPAQSWVKNCLIYDIGRVTKQVAGIYLSMAQEITVEHCTIMHTPRAGICINEGAFGGHLIRDNFIFDTVRETGDHGPINSWGRDRHWRDTHASNPKRDVPDNVWTLSTLDMSNPNEDLLPNRIEHNRFEHSAILHSGGHVSGFFSWGMDLDDGSSNYILRDNLCIGCSFKLREGFNRLVENNICIGPIPPEKHQQYANNGDIIRRNIIYNTNDTSPFKLSHEGLPKEAKEIDYNLYFSPRGQIDLTYPHQNGVELHSIVADPEFMDPDHWNFQLKPSSPAFTVGFKPFSMDSFGSQIPHHQQIITEDYKRYRANKSGTDLLSAKLENAQEWLGATLKNLSTEQEKSATGMHAIIGVLALRVPADSVAAQIGLQENDVILKINETEITDLAKFQEKLAQIEDQDESMIIIFRYQQEMELEL